MYIYTYTLIHTHACIHTYTTDIPIYLCTHLYIVLSVPSSIPPYTFYTPLLYIVHPYTHSYNCLLYLYISIYTYIHTPIHIHIYPYTHTYMPLYTNTYIHTYLHLYPYLHSTNQHIRILLLTPRPAYIPLTPYRHVHPCPTII